MKEEMPRAWLLVGAPGSGKSTWAASKKDSLSDDVKIVSRDQVRYSIVREDEAYFSKESLVFSTFAEEVIKSINTHKDTIIDATHMTIKSRRKLMNRIVNFIRPVEFNVVILMPPIEVCLQRNSTRRGRTRVPDQALRRIYDGYQEPKYSEGYTNIYKMKNN